MDNNKIMVEKEEIIEGNKLLAKFEGYKYYEKTKTLDEWEWGFDDIEIYSNKPIVYEFTEEECKEYNMTRYFNSYEQGDGFKCIFNLKYNSDYNDLMRVWFKFVDIESILLTIPKEQHDNYFNYMHEISNILPFEPINVVFRMLIPTIEWYTKIKIINEN